jgi:hypothetical protein
LTKGRHLMRFVVAKESNAINVDSFRLTAAPPSAK